MTAATAQGRDSETRILLFVVDHHARTGRGPLYGEITETLGLSRQVVHRHLHALRDAGLVDFEDRKQGTLRPLVGRIT